MAIEHEQWRPLKQSGLRSVRLGIAILFHPVDGFEELQQNEESAGGFRADFADPSVRIVTIYMTSFHMTSLQPEYADLNLEMIRFVVPLLSGVIACYLITAIMDGEAYFSQILTAMSYALIPYIVFAIPLAALSTSCREASSGCITASISSSGCGWPCSSSFS